MIKKRVGLDSLTTIHLDGWIDVNIIENIDDIFEIEKSFVLIGGGSNLLIKNKQLGFYKLSKAFSYVRTENNLLVCGAALKISNLMKFLIKKSISSLEFLAGVPATIGGAVIMNAGAFGEAIDKRVVYIKAVCDKAFMTLKKEDIEFGYRTSNLENCTILEAGFVFSTISNKQIRSSIAKNIKRRITNAHLKNTFGSVFKNPFGDYAGRLIEESGLKGLKKNSAMISNKHANYIIGSRKTDVDDVLFLIDRAKEVVFKNFGVELEEEVKIL